MFKILLKYETLCKLMMKGIVLGLELNHFRRYVVCKKSANLAQAQQSNIDFCIGMLLNIAALQTELGDRYWAIVYRPLYRGYAWLA